MKLLATHITRYWYSRSGFHVPHRSASCSRARARARPFSSHALDVTPTPDSVLPREDYFGNPVTFFSIAEPHRELIITSRSAGGSGTGPAAQLWISRPPGNKCATKPRSATRAETFEAGQFIFESPPYPGRPRRSREYAAASFAPGRPLLSAVDDLSRRILQRVSLRSSAPPPLGLRWMQCSESRRGVCQDFAHLMIACLRR